jgi:CheY-like chemotaxis protein
MILLLSASSSGPEVAKKISDSAGEKTQLVNNVRAALQQLHAHEFSTIVIDESLPELDGEKLDALLRRAESALPAFVNFSLSGADRLTTQAVAAVRRSRQEHGAAQKVAKSELQGQLCSEITSIILGSEQLMQMGLPSPALSKVVGVLEVARRMGTFLKAPDFS